MSKGSRFWWVFLVTACVAVGVAVWKFIFHDYVSAIFDVLIAGGFVWLALYNRKRLIQGP